MLTTFSDIEAVWVARWMSVALVLSGATVVFVEAASLWGKREASRFFGALFGVGAASEICGVYTGLPFGAYKYTKRMVADDPLAGRGALSFAASVCLGDGGGVRLADWVYGGRTVGLDSFLGRCWRLWSMFRWRQGMTAVLGYWEWESVGPVFGAPLLNSAGLVLWLLLFAGWVGTRGR